MKQPSPLFVAALFVIIILFLAYHVKGQPSAPPAKGTAEFQESVYRAQRKAAMATVITPEALFVIPPKVTNSCTLLVTNNTITISNGYKFAPPFNVYWSSNVNGPYSNALFVAQGNTNWMETFQFIGNRFFYTKRAANVTN